MRFLLLIVAATATVMAEEACRNLNKHSCDSLSYCEWTLGSFCNWAADQGKATNDGSEVNEEGDYLEKRAVTPYSCSLFNKEVFCEANDNCHFSKDQGLAWGEQCIDKPITEPPTDSQPPTPSPTETPTRPVCSELRFSDCKANTDEGCQWTLNAFCMDTTNAYVEPYNCNLFHSRALCEGYMFNDVKQCSYSLERDHGLRCADATPSPTADPTSSPVDPPSPNPTRVNCLDLSRNDCTSSSNTGLCEWNGHFCNDVEGGPNHQDEPYNCNLFDNERSCEGYMFNDERVCMYDFTLDFDVRCIDYTPSPTPAPTDVACLVKTKVECKGLTSSGDCEWTKDSFCNFPDGHAERLAEPFSCAMFEQRRQCEDYMFDSGDGMARVCQFDGGKDFGQRCENYVAPPTPDPTESPTSAPTDPPVRPTCRGMNKKDCQNTAVCEYMRQSYCDDRDTPYAEPVACSLFTRKHACEKYTHESIEQCKYDRTQSPRCFEFAPTAEPSANPTAAFVPEPTSAPTLVCGDLNRRDCLDNSAQCTFRLNSFCDENESSEYEARPQPYDCNAILKKHDCNGYTYAEDASFFGCFFDRSLDYGQRCQSKSAPTEEPTAFPTDTPETPAPTDLVCLGKRKKDCRKNWSDVCVWKEDSFCDKIEGGTEEPYPCNYFERKQACHRYRFGDEDYAADYRRCNYNKAKAFGERCEDNEFENTEEPTAFPTLSPTSEPTPENCFGKTKTECRGKWKDVCFYQQEWCDSLTNPVVSEREGGGYDCNLYRKKHGCHANRNDLGHRLCYYDTSEDDHNLRCKDKDAPTPSPTANPVVDPTPSPTNRDCHLKTYLECVAATLDGFPCEWTLDSFCEDTVTPFFPQPYACNLFKKHHACLLNVDADENQLCMYDHDQEYGDRCIDFTARPTPNPTAPPTFAPTENPTQQICEGMSFSNCKNTPSCRYRFSTWCEGPYEVDADGNETLMAEGYEKRTPYQCSDFFKQSPCTQNTGCRYDKSRSYYIDPDNKELGGNQCYQP